METKSKICPVCSKEFQGTKEHPSSTIVFCPNCGWMRIFMPEVIPNVLQKQEEERQRIAKEAYANKIASEEERGKLSARVEKMKDELDLANEKIAKDEQYIRKLQSGLDKAKASAQQNQATAPHTEVKGFVMLKNLETYEESTEAIFEGLNVYGSKENNGLCHKIKLDPVAFDFEPEQFSIDTTRPKGWVLRDLAKGAIQTKAGKVPDNGVYVNNTLGRVLINDIIEIRIVKL